jgi:hypothetical protein
VQELGIVLSGFKALFSEELGAPGGNFVGGDVHPSELHHRRYASRSC